MRDLEESSMLEINGLKQENNGLYLMNEGLKKQLESKKKWLLLFIIDLIIEKLLFYLLVASCPLIIFMKKLILKIKKI